MRKKPIALTGSALIAIASVIGAPALTAQAADSDHGSVTALLRDRAPAIQGAAGDRYQQVNTSASKDGTTHTRYTRTYHGLPVIGGDFVVHSKDGKVVGQTVAQQAPIRVGTTPTVAGTAARTAAAAGAKAFNLNGATTPMLVVDARGAQPTLAWMTVVNGVQADGVTPSRKAVLVNAGTGTVIRSSELVTSLMSAQTSRQAMRRIGTKIPNLSTVVPATLPVTSWASADPAGAVRGTADRTTMRRAVAAEGTGHALFLGEVSLTTTDDNGTFTMSDPVRGGNTACDMRNSESGDCEQFTDEDNTWGDGTNDDRATAGVDVYYGAATTWDYYQDAYGRNGIFDDGSGVPSRAHYGSGYVNAFWDGEQMTYGDGEGDAKPLVAIDVAGHEMSHGVAQALANLGYEGDVGGINESNSDINGTMVELKANSSEDKPDFLIGEEIDINGDGTPLRYMDEPSKDGASLDCWSSSTQNQDPHFTSGVGNHFFFLLANGSGESKWGSSPTCNDSTVAGIGADQAAKIWYNALKDYGTSNMSYADMRAATVKSADAEFGSGSTESQAVAAAWDAVSVN